MKAAENPLRAGVTGVGEEGSDNRQALRSNPMAQLAQAADDCLLPLLDLANLFLTRRHALQQLWKRT